jgi:outer membrane protein assembly factor BamD
MSRTRVALLALAALSTGCSYFSFLKLNTASNGEVTYGADAEANYTTGMKDIDNEDWIAAAKHLDYVSTKFPYSKYASLAELAAADALFKQEKYIEAADKYVTFLKLHPTHPKADYAAFQVGLSHEKEIPTDWFFMPSSAEKDQTDVKTAVSTFEDFVKNYAPSPLVPEANLHIVSLRHRLADHEMRVAQYYLDHAHPQAAANRYETLVRTYPADELAPEALIRLGRIYVELKAPDKARPFLEQLVKQFPSDRRVGEARRLLGVG